MADWMVLVLIIGYIFIGLVIAGFVAGLTQDIDCGMGLIIVFWPVMLLGLIIGGLLILPFKLGEWLQDRF